MAEYLFKCKECGTKFVIVGSYMTMISTDKVCPDCTSDNVKRVYSVSGIHFKGNGFYTTDKDK